MTEARPSWLGLACSGAVVRRALVFAVVVGSVLVAINHGDLIAAGHLTDAAIWKIPMTYCVPYCVSTYASVSAIRSHDKRP